MKNTEDFDTFWKRKQHQEKLVNGLDGSSEWRKEYAALHSEKERIFRTLDLANNVINGTYKNQPNGIGISPELVMPGYTYVLGGRFGYIEDIAVEYVESVDDGEVKTSLADPDRQIINTYKLDEFASKVVGGPFFLY
jgi:hypothetical protein